MGVGIVPPPRLMYVAFRSLCVRLPPMSPLDPGLDVLDAPGFADGRRLTGIHKVKPPPVYSIVNATGTAPILVLADHGGNAIPPALRGLGLTEEVLDRHIAWDPGSAVMARRVAERLKAPAIIHHYSRLLIDPNREVADPTSICVISDEVVVPGNRGLSADDMQARADRFFHPYHQAISDTLDGFAARGVAPVILSMHSFTPIMRGRTRPWQIGVLYGDDDRLAIPLMDRLCAVDPDLVIGDNEPYSGRNMHGYTIETHALSRGLANVLIEARQDLVRTDDGAIAWADRLIDALIPLLDEPHLYRARSA